MQYYAHAAACEMNASMLNIQPTSDKNLRLDLVSAEYSWQHYGFPAMNTRACSIAVTGPALAKLMMVMMVFAANQYRPCRRTRQKYRPIFLGKTTRAHRSFGHFIGAR